MFPPNETDLPALFPDIEFLWAEPWLLVRAGEGEIWEVLEAGTISKGFPPFCGGIVTAWSLVSRSKVCGYSKFLSLELLMFWLLWFWRPIDADMFRGGDY